jgi:hypothetical protein
MLPIQLMSEDKMSKRDVEPKRQILPGTHIFLFRVPPTLGEVFYESVISKQFFRFETKQK